MAIDMNRLSLNSDGAFRTTMHNRMPQTRNNTSTRKKNKQTNSELDILFD